MAKTHPVDLAYLVGLTESLRKTGMLYRGEEHDSLIVNPETQVWHWNSRGESGDAVDWIRMMYGCSMSEAFGIMRGMPATAIPLERSKPKPQEPMEMSMAVRYHDDLTPDGYAYWKGRGVPARIVDALVLGEAWGSYTIPVIVDGRLMGVKHRNKMDKKPRYWLKASQPGYQLYVPWKIGDMGFVPTPYDPLVLVGGEIKAMVLAAHGIAAVSSTGGAASWDQSWADAFSYRKVIICLDPNEYLPEKNGRSIADIVEDSIRLYAKPSSIRRVITEDKIDDMIVDRRLQKGEIERTLGL